MIDAYATFKAIERVANTNELSLKMTTDPQPWTDLVNRTVHVPEINAYWSKQRLTVWLGYVYHEIGHHAPEVVDTIDLLKEKKFKMDSQTGRLYNILDDYRQEKNGLGMWPGRDEALSWTQAYHCADGAHNIRTKGFAPDMELIINVFGWVYTARGDWQPDVAFPAVDFASVVPDPDKYSHLTAELNAAVTAEDVYNLVIKILGTEGHDTEQDKKSEEGEGEGEGEEKSSKGKAKDKGGEDGEDSAKGTVSYKDLMAHVHKEGKASEDSYTITYDHEPSKDYTPWTKMLVTRPKGTLNKAYNEAITELYESGKKLSGQVFRLFQSRTQSQTVHNKKSGRLDKRDLYRVPTGSLDVFTSKESRIDVKGTAIHILTDMSGSMLGDKFVASGAAVCLLQEALTPLGIPVKITGFTECFKHGTMHYILKDWTERPSPKKFIEEYGKCWDRMIQNADGESILWGAAQLYARPEPRKILLVLSDGMPCADNAGDCYTFTKDVVREVSKKIECYGIGILDDSVSKFYPDHTVLYRLDDLEACLFDVVKKKLF